MKLLLRILPFSLILLLFATSLSGQGTLDALRYSRWEVGGTARTVGVGGAIGALGADFASLSTNPAGLGAFRRSELTVTPSFFLQNSRAGLQDEAFGSTTTANLSEFTLNNIGLVFVRNSNNPRLPNFNFGIGLNRLADLHDQFEYDGYTEGSIVDRWQDLANQGFFDPFEVELAEAVGAIYDLEGDGRYETDMELNPTARIRKQQEFSSSGSISEVVFAMGGNFNNHLFFGLTVGVPLLNYRQTDLYREFNDPLEPSEEIPFFQELSYLQNLQVSGTGINAKFGLIYRFNQAFRLGAAVHTPTRFSLQEEFTSDLRYAFIDGSFVSDTTALSPISNFDYRLSTPWRFIGSAALVVNRFGFLSAEVEYLDYGTNRLRFANFPEDEANANEDISAQLRSALILRLGAELALGGFRARAGFNLSPQPVEGADGTDLGWSAGLGYRWRGFFVDMAFTQQVRNQLTAPYFIDNPAFFQPIVDRRITNRRLMLTAGIKF